MAESVISTIEVKSTLTEKELGLSFNSIRNVKALTRHTIGGIGMGYRPPHIISFIVAYGGPVNMSTICRWINRYIVNNRISYPHMGTTLTSRMGVVCPLADMIIVLGKGFLHFDNLPGSLITDAQRSSHPTSKWIIKNQETGNLFMMFTQLIGITSGIFLSLLDFNQYLSNINLGIGTVQFSP